MLLEHMQYIIFSLGGSRGCCYARIRVQVAHSTKTGENQKHELHEEEMEWAKVVPIRKQYQDSSCTLLETVMDVHTETFNL